MWLHFAKYNQFFEIQHEMFQKRIFHSFPYASSKELKAVIIFSFVLNFTVFAMQWTNLKIISLFAVYWLKIEILNSVVIFLHSFVLLLTKLIYSVIATKFCIRGRPDINYLHRLFQVYFYIFSQFFCNVLNTKRLIYNLRKQEVNE